MRIRSIKPQFWVDEDLATLNRDTRLFYIGLWNLADDAGVFEWRPGRIKAMLFPYDTDIYPKTIEQMLKDLANIGDIVSFEYQGKRFGYIPTFNVHQEISHPSRWKFAPVPSSYKTMSNTPLVLNDNSPTTNLGLTQPSVSTNPPLQRAKNIDENTAEKEMVMSNQNDTNTLHNNNSVTPDGKNTMPNTPLVLNENSDTTNLALPIGKRKRSREKEKESINNGDTFRNNLADETLSVGEETTPKEKPLPEKKVISAQDSKNFNFYRTLLLNSKNGQSVAVFVEAFKEWHTDAPLDDYKNAGSRFAAMSRDVTDRIYILSKIWSTATAQIAGSHLNYIQGSLKAYKPPDQPKKTVTDYYPELKGQPDWMKSRTGNDTSKQ